ncbi:SMI1/KNR4 family protein [Pseudomonas marginalis]|nr:SMI1/KNR4 family protein [Pseudomonas marginalis]
MSLTKIIDLIENSDCTTVPSAGLPNGPIPNDLADFYQHYSSAVFYPQARYSFTIPSPILERSDFVVMNEDLEDPDSANWYVLVKCEDQIISIDLTPGPQFGYCYDSFWDSYPSADESTLIAKSFTELVEKIIKSGGKNLFWVPGHT